MTRTPLNTLETWHLSPQNKWLFTHSRENQTYHRMSDHVLTTEWPLSLIPGLCWMLSGRPLTTLRQPPPPIPPATPNASGQHGAGRSLLTSERRQIFGSFNGQGEVLGRGNSSRSRDESQQDKSERLTAEAGSGAGEGEEEMASLFGCPDCRRCYEADVRLETNTGSNIAGQVMISETLTFNSRNLWYCWYHPDISLYIY